MSREAFDLFCYPGTDQPKSLRLKPMTIKQEKVYNLKKRAWNVKRIAKRLKITERTVYDMLRKIKQKGWMV